MDCGLRRMFDEFMLVSDVVSLFGRLTGYTGELRRRQHRERIHHEMAARRAELVGDSAPRMLACDGRKFRVQRELRQPRVGACILAESDDAGDAAALALLLQAGRNADCRG